MKKKQVLFFLICLIGMMGISMLTRDYSRAAEITGVVTASSLNLRKGPGTDYESIGKISNGTTVTVVSTVNDWYQVKVTLNGTLQTGYVSASYIALNTTATPTPSPTITPAPTTTTVVYYRNEKVKEPIAVAAKTSYKTRTYKNTKSTYYRLNKKIVTLSKNKKVTIVGEKKVKNKKWFKVTFTYSKKKRTAYLPEKALVMTLKTKAYAKVNCKKSSIKLYKKKSTKAANVKSGKKTVKLKKGTYVEIGSDKLTKKQKWYKVYGTYNGKKVSGWTKSNNITLAKRTVTKKVKVEALSELDFEKSMTSQGFPDSYKKYLRILHQKYPYWQFKAYKTGLKFEEALTAESKLGVNLISNSKSAAWKSKEPGAYDATTGKWTVYDGSTWVAASKEAIAYYMDPRNFLNERTIFMFESLEFQPEYQTVTGVNQILNNTPFANQSFTYADLTTGAAKTISYTNAFMAAAKSNNVSPYHLASRVKQEVVTSATTTSIAVTGTNSTYPGIYNFYNIGATSGTNPALNGLKWASTGTTYLRPWTDRYRSIVGGGQYIAQSYIAKGQNTGYLEKFNLTPNNRYNHQYMTNVEAAYSEAIKTKNAYAGMMDSTSIVFSIPVFTEMPESVCPAPQ
ncbi:MAG: SH3 domain-containing protein [Eubacterium sp.]|nr:SH3 domain-containing protein [Eubacterium sp.]